MYVIGHKGAAGYAYENTASSIIEALRLDLQGIEIDVQETKDNVILLQHDRAFIDANNKPYLIGDLDFETFSDMFQEKTGHHPCTLDEACRLVANQCQLFIELKHHPSTSHIIETATKHLDYRNFVIASFDHSEIYRIKQDFAAVQTMALIESFPLGLRTSLKQCGCDYAGLGFEGTSKEQVEDLTGEGFELIAWTVDTAEDVQLAEDMGFDGIISNYPGEAIRSPA
jgi:glycerophosphoryl diester phosphodiesterase